MGPNLNQHKNPVQMIYARTSFSAIGFELILFWFGGRDLFLDGDYHRNHLLFDGSHWSVN